jgi:cell division protein FtsI (penicillin-binding protein 3)
VYGYTVAGKTGTAEIACSEIENSGCTGYHPTLHNLSFVGFLPADEPRVSIIIKLDELPGFASESAAPAFKQLVERLVVLMNIPTDEQRRQLREAGGNTAEIALR